MNFTFPTMRTVRLDHINIRNETHGDKPVTAVDLRFIVAGSNDLLALFAPGLQQALCFNQAAEQGQQDIGDVPTVLPNLRFPKMAPLVWTDEIATARVEIDYGTGGPSNIILNPCKVNNFKAELKEGGSTEISFRVQTSNVTPEVIGALTGKLKCETQITLTLPEVAKGTIDGSTAAFQKDYPDAKPTGTGEPDATDLFVAQNAGVPLQ